VKSGWGWVGGNIKRTGVLVGNFEKNPKTAFLAPKRYDEYPLPLYKGVPPPHPGSKILPLQRRFLANKGHFEYSSSNPLSMFVTP